MGKHTPSPWFGNETLIEDSWRGYPFWVGEIVGANGNRIVAGLPDYRFDSSEVDEDRANLFLLAAAPELLEALTGCIEHMEYSTPQGKAAYETARAAIAKAAGESP